MIKKVGLVIATGFLVSACSTPHVMEEKKVSDESLNCSQLTEEITKAEKFEADARSKKGVTGTNVAAALFFWPAMIATYKNADDAIAAAKTRKEHLMTLRKDKNCS